MKYLIMILKNAYKFFSVLVAMFLRLCWVIFFQEHQN